MTHEELCKATARKYVQTFALWEVKGKWENPDVITWNSSGRSTIYEIKMSRSDFLADFKKKCRQAERKKAGCKFYYVCCGDFIKKEEVPEDWGLIYYINGKFKEIKCSPNHWEDWDKIDQNRDLQGEIICLHPIISPICKLRLGYLNTYMKASIKNISIIDGKSSDLHIDKPVYAIHLDDVKEVK